jgi:hypothetical protein
MDAIPVLKGNGDRERQQYQHQSKQYHDDGQCYAATTILSIAAIPHHTPPSSQCFCRRPLLWRETLPGGFPAKTKYPAAKYFLTKAENI